MDQPAASGYAPVNGIDLYWESYGEGGTPLVLVHGGYGLIGTLGELIAALSRDRQVVGIELQGHGHTRDIDRRFTWEAFGDDIAGAIAHLGLGPADLLGHSLGATASLRAAVQHPELVRRLVLVSIPVRRDGWFPEVREAFDRMDSPLFEQLRHSPLYAGYVKVAPDPDAFVTLIEKTGELLRRPYDWSGDVHGLPAETMLVYADADSIPVAHIAEFYALLDGGLRDAGWREDQPGRPLARLAILPGLSHYDIADAPQLIEVVRDFLG